MTIIEAFEKKKPVLRPKRTWSYTLDPYGTSFLSPTAWKSPEFLLYHGCLQVEDILATDWEVKDD